MKQTYFTSGEFAHLCGTTKETLRHYNNIGLLKPAKTTENGYQYYSAFQFYDFYFISAFKGTGMHLKELEEKQGKFSLMEAARVHAAALMHQGIDNALELTYYERLRVHNLKYYTWVEQQGKTYEELNRQWYDRNYWKDIPKMTETIDEMIKEFNEMIKG